MLCCTLVLEPSTSIIPTTTTTTTTNIQSSIANTSSNDNLLRTVRCPLIRGNPLYRVLPYRAVASRTYKTFYAVLSAILGHSRNRFRGATFIQEPSLRYVRLSKGPPPRPRKRKKKPSKNLPMSRHGTDSQIFPRIMLFLAGCAAVTVQAANDESTLAKRQTTHTLFKGQEIPDVNWTSPDTYNFTWGLTGVDNHENLKFGYVPCPVRWIGTNCERWTADVSVGGRIAGTIWSRPQVSCWRFSSSIESTWRICTTLG